MRGDNEDMALSCLEQSHTRKCKRKWRDQGRTQAHFQCTDGAKHVKEGEEGWVGEGEKKRTLTRGDARHTPSTNTKRGRKRAELHWVCERAGEIRQRSQSYLSKLLIVLVC